MVSRINLSALRNS